MKEEIFTIGDKTNQGIISSFKLVDNIMYVLTNNDKDMWNITKGITKAKTPLFKDFLGNDVFEGDIVYMVVTDYNVLEEIQEINTIKEIKIQSAEHYTKEFYTTTRQLKFKNKSDAEEYLISNAKVLSLEDLNNNWQFQHINNIKCVHGSNTIKELKQLICQKLNLK